MSSGITLCAPVSRDLDHKLSDPLTGGR
jgi:hypothetical protein